MLGNKILWENLQKKKGRIGRAKSVKQTVAYVEILASSSRIYFENYDQNDVNKWYTNSIQMCDTNQKYIYIFFQNICLTL